MRATVPSLCTIAVLVAAFADGQPPSPAQAIAHYRSGLTELDSGHVEQAIPEFREAVRLDPLLGLAHYGLGRALMTLKRYPEAAQAFVAARDAYRQADELARQARARTELNSKVKLLDDVDYHELDHNRRFPMGYVYEPERTRALDIPKDKHAGRASPVPAEVFAALGSAYLRMGALSEAEQAYLEALQVRPDLGEVHNNLAVVYLQTGRIAEADREVALSEQAGFRVNPGLKQEIAARRPR